jgi:hypothetical protein
MFDFLSRAIAAAIQITGYTLVFVGQAIWFLANGRRDKVGDAFGSYGKWSVDALSRIFKTQ